MIELGSDKNGNCMTQFKLYVVDKLSSLMFCCHPTKSPFFPIYTGKETFADPEPPYTNQLTLNKYQRVSLYTDPEPSNVTIKSPNK